MMLANRELRVVLATIHVPLSAVPALITPETELTTIRLSHGACLRAGIASPRVAVAGLNPHAGESGRFWPEDNNVLAPALAQARADGIHARGPRPGHTFFLRPRQRHFHIVVVPYHAQRLICVQYLGVDDGLQIN